LDEDDKMKKTALDITVQDKPGVLQSVAELISKSGANIAHISSGERRADKTKIYLEIEDVKSIEKIIEGLEKMKFVLKVKEVPTFTEVYGKRVIIIGGGAQVAEVARGAISEADRHNLRGERISVDTIPLVGEDKLEKAVKAVARLPRARMLVLAGSIMGGKVTEAVQDLRDKGVYAISLNMEGSVPDACDLVVTDPVQAGVMAVMAIADTAEFDITRARKKKY
jgi:energy-converting hydrogenase B subunit Q